jgi:rhamnosyl/mannosyltransferase
MKVLHVYRTYFPDSQGGLEEVIRQICLNTRELEVESRVFSLSPTPEPAEIDAPEGRVVRVRQAFEIASCGFTFSGIAEFRRQVDWADIVHYHFPWPYADVLHAMAGYPQRAVVTYHSDIVRQKFLSMLYRPLMHRFLGSMDRIVATSPNYLATSDVLRHYGEKVDIVPIGINRASYPALEPDSPVLDRVEAEYGRDFFLFVGVLRYYKGLHILLDAIQGAPFQVLIAGAGPVEEALRKQAHELGLDNVRFCGYVDDEVKMAMFALCRGVVFPSYLRSEAFGVTLLEGAMCGKPLVSAEVGSGTSHINMDHKTGYVVTPGCPRSLRQALDRLHENPEQAESMGRQARNRFEELFTGEIMGRRYAEVYRDVLSHAGQRGDFALGSHR